VERYFASLQSLWETRSYAIAASVINGLYPGALANQALRDATAAWLDANPEPPALRRIVIENLAGVDRALAAQKKDAGSK
jgi:aminopeptidase N